MSLTFRQCRYFLALAQTGHFGRAAELCHVSQPALSVQIREMEAALGVTLVERDSRDIRLTPKGREIAARAARVLEEVRGIEEVARRAGGLSGRLALGVIPTVAPYLLPHALPLLRARDLTLDLGVREATTPVLVEELRAGRLDAAVVALPSGQPDLVETTLVTDPFLLAVSEGKARRMTAPPTPQGVDPGQLLLLDDGHCLTDQALEVCGIAGTGRTDLRAASLSTLLRLVENGYGMTLVPRLALAVELPAAPGLAVLPFAGAQPFRTIGLVRRRQAVEDGWFAELAGLLREAAALAAPEAGPDGARAPRHPGRDALESPG